MYPVQTDSIAVMVSMMGFVRPLIQDPFKRGGSSYPVKGSARRQQHKMYEQNCTHQLSLFTVQVLCYTDMTKGRRSTVSPMSCQCPSFVLTLIYHYHIVILGQCALVSQGLTDSKFPRWAVQFKRCIQVVLIDNIPLCCRLLTVWSLELVDILYIL